LTRGPAVKWFSLRVSRVFDTMPPVVATVADFKPTFPAGMAHNYPLENDLILRPLAFVAGTQYYVILNALTLQRQAGPFASLGEATLAARDLAALRGVDVWREWLDGGGNPLGSPVLLFHGRI
jgi:hypothetical protein